MKNLKTVLFLPTLFRIDVLADCSLFDWLIDFLGLYLLN